MSFTGCACSEAGGAAATVAFADTGAVSTPMRAISARVIVCIGSQGGMRSARSSMSIEPPISAV